MGSSHPLVASVIRLRGKDRRILQRVVRCHKSEQRAVLRAKIILWAARGAPNTEIAFHLGVDVKTVRKWRDRFKYWGLIGLDDLERPGRPRLFDSKVRHELFSLVVQPPPEPYCRWSLDLLAKTMVDRRLVDSISIETLSTWLREAELKPHKVRGWLSSNDPEFRAKRDRIMNLYLRPPKNTFVLSVDEKTNIQALKRVRKDLPASRGRARRVEWEYVRHGVVNLLACFDVRTGQVVGQLVGKNDSKAFIGFLKMLLRLYPRRKICLVLDNGTTHRSHETMQFYARNPRLLLYFTPTHASWLNQVELWFSALGRHALHKASFDSLEKLKCRVTRYIAHHNQELAKPYEWTTKGKPLTGLSARERRRRRSTLREFRKAVRS